jgi:hypothetical protein
MAILPRTFISVNSRESFLMKSPFPGMDPYIEVCGLWADFHTHLIEKIYEQLAEAVSERYLVRTGERSYVVLVESAGKQSIGGTSRGLRRDL